MACFSYICVSKKLIEAQSYKLIIMQNTTSLNKLKKGERAKIVSFDDNSLPAKFFELGFIPGAIIEVKHKAPLQGPICVSIIQNNTLIALRVTEASIILTDKI